MHFIALLLAALLAWASTAAAQVLPFPPAAQVKLALNPITQKAYVVDEANDRVLVQDRTGTTIATIGVGPRPQYIAVDPSTNRVYVNNAGNSSLTIIDGTTDTNLTPTPRGIGSLGAISVNPLTGVVYIIRFTSPATDEVTFYRPQTDTWYTIATESWQPISMAVDPVANKIYVAHYAGDLRIIGGTYDENDFFPATIGIPMWNRLFAVVQNPVTNKAYVIIDDSRGPIGIVDGVSQTASFPAIQAGHAVSPKGLAINTATNRIYAAFADEIIVIDGGSGALTYVPASTGSGPAAVAVNAVTNKVYVAADNGVLTILDGDTNATTTATIPAGASTLGVNPISNQVFVFNGTTTTVRAGATGTTHPIPLTTAITPLPGNSSGPNPTLTLTVTGAYAGGLPARRVYYRLDGLDGTWTAAAGSGPYTAALSGLSAGPHTLRAFAVDGQELPIATGPQSYGSVGAIASYAFTVAANATVSLATSANPSTIGQSVTFTASVSGTGGTPGGTVQFRDGATAISGCGAVTLASGSAACSSAGLAAGARSITAVYSGDATFAGATSAPLTQNVNRASASVALASNKNPALVNDTVRFIATVSVGSGTPGGTVTFRDGTSVICNAVAMNAGEASCFTATLAQGTHSITAAYSGNATYSPATSAALQQSVQAQIPPPGQVSFSRGQVDFAVQSMGTTSPAQPLVVTNTGTVNVNVTFIETSAQYSQGNDCGTLTPGAMCTISLFFTPAASAGTPLNGAFTVGGGVQVTSSADGSPHSIALTGVAEKSLVTHFYRSILHRVPDAGGHDFWQGEAARVAGLGANVNEAWFAMAAAFYTSAEYAQQGRDDTGFVGDAYRTFFNRAPDSSGQAFWLSNLQQGMPREVVLAAFMFSAEFRNFTQAVFGNTAARAEMDMAGDFYRGLLARLPDDGGFDFWVGRFRAAQCNGAAAVRAQADEISAGFIAGGEYTGRDRGNAQYVGDLYNAFLRRGGDLDGVKFWIDSLDSGARTREQVRQAFRDSAEFGNRVQAVIDQGCAS